MALANPKQSQTTMRGDCEIVTYDGLGTAKYARCVTHGCAQLGRYRTQREALQEFVCDHGTGWRFIIQYEPADPPFMVDLSALLARARGDEEAHHLGSYDGPPPQIWRWTGDGQTEPVTIQHIDGTGEWVPNGTDENAPKVAHPQFTVTGPDGTEYTRFTVTLVEV